MSDVVVIGAGISGLSAALQLRAAGASVTLATFGIGGLPLSPGTLDVLGYAPDRVARPLDAIEQLPPEHPLRVIGADAVRQGVASFAEECGPDLILNEPIETNRVVPTALGVLRPTALVPPSMAAGNLQGHEKVLVVGIRQFKDFHAEHMAANLQRSLPQGEARALEVDLEVRGEADPTGMAIAHSLDDAAQQRALIGAIRPHLRPGEIVALPAVLGHHDHNAWKVIRDGLGTELFEVSALPPSLPGVRLNDHLTSAVKKARVRWILGSRVIGGEFSGGRLTSVTLKTAGSPRRLKADHFIFAPGGFESGALQLDSHRQLSEPALGLPVWAPNKELVHLDYLGAEMPLFEAGVLVDRAMRPIDPLTRELVADNLYAAGGILAGSIRWAQKTGEGIALGSAYKASAHILEELS